MNIRVLGLALLLTAGPAAAQDTPDLLRRYGTSDSEALFEVKTVAIQRTDVAVLTDPDPAVHVFGGAGATLIRQWGRGGNGPAELVSPVDIAWADNGHVLVLDVNQRKIVSYTSDGRFESSRALDGITANRLFVVGSDTILGAFAPISRARAVLRLRGIQQDTLLEYETRGEQIRLVAEGSPRLTIGSPFVPQVVWTVLPTGGLAVWDPNDGMIRVHDRSGRLVRELGPIDGALAITAADREHWFSSAIPSDFMGQRVFEPVRRQAREVVEFPERLPAVLRMLSDPKAGIWVGKSTSRRGELWELLDEAGGRRGRVQFAPDRQLLRVGQSSFVVLAVDDLGVEVVEQYALPEWAN